MSIPDLDVNNYTEEELFSIIKYEGDYENASIDSIKEQVDRMISKSIIKYDTYDEIGDKNHYEANETTKTLIKFLGNVNDKLLSYIEKRVPVQYNPSNYDIIQSQNQLQGGSHAIITQKNIPVVNVSDYKYPTGVINPIERRTIKKIISIDSVFRQNYDKSSPSDFVWVLPDREQKVVSVKIVSLELPIMWYSVSEKNNSNTFQLKTYNIVGQPNKTHTITMPSGNYMASDFGTSLTNYMLNKGDGLEYLICSVNSTTTKTIIRARNTYDGGCNPYDVIQPYYSPNFYFTIDFGDNIINRCEIVSNSKKIHQKKNENRYGQYCLGSFMGFSKRFYEVKRDDTYIDYAHNGNNISKNECVLQSEASYGNGRTNYIFIYVDDYNNNYISESIIASSTDNYLGTNILGRITINESFNSIMMNTASDKIYKQRDYMGPVNLNKLHIKLLDKYGNIIDINNNDVSLAIEITSLYS